MAGASGEIDVRLLFFISARNRGPQSCPARERVPEMKTLLGVLTLRPRTVNAEPPGFSLNFPLRETKIRGFIKINFKRFRLGLAQNYL